METASPICIKFISFFLSIWKWHGVDMSFKIRQLEAIFSSFLTGNHEITNFFFFLQRNVYFNKGYELIKDMISSATFKPFPFCFFCSELLHNACDHIYAVPKLHTLTKPNNRYFLCNSLDIS